MANHESDRTATSSGTAAPDRAVIDIHLEGQLHGQRRILLMIKWLLYLAFVVIAYTVLRRLAPVLTPVLAAAGIAYLLDPVVDRIQARGFDRVRVVLGLLLLFLGSIVGGAVILIPLVAEDVSRFIFELPAMVDRAAMWIAANLGYDVPTEWKSALKSEEASSVLREIAGPASAMAAAAVGGFFSFMSFLAELLLIPVFAFYFLVDWDDIVSRTRSMIPPRHRAPVVDIVVEIDAVVSSWIRGQFTVIAILAFLYATFFYFLDVQLGISVGLLVGLLNIIPFVGAIVGSAITVTLVLLDWQGPGQLLAVAGVLIGLNLVEATVLTPKIVGKKVGLGESGALFAVVAGGQLLGFAGVLLAVPLAASVAVLIRRLIRYYERSEFYGADDADTSNIDPLLDAPASAGAVTLGAPAAKLITDPPAQGDPTRDDGSVSEPSEEVDRE